MKKTLKNNNKLNDSGGIMLSKAKSRLLSGKRKKSKNSGTTLKLSLPGILIFAFYLLLFAFPNMALAQGAGKTYYFYAGDGGTDEVDCGNDASLNISGSGITLEAWVYDKGGE